MSKNSAPQGLESIEQEILNIKQSLFMNTAPSRSSGHLCRLTCALAVSKRLERVEWQ